MASYEVPTSYLLKLAVVFGLGAVPGPEVLVAVPVGVVLGLAPAVATAAAVAGNVASVLALAVVLPRLAVFLRLKDWITGTFLQQKRKEGDDGLSWRHGRFWYLWNRYGVPGAGLGAPVVTGTHMAIILCVILGASAGRTVAWTTVGIFAWGATVGVACHLGLEVIRYLVPEWTIEWAMEALTTLKP